MSPAAYTGLITAVITAVINIVLSILVIKSDYKNPKNIFLFLFIFIFGVGAQVASALIILSGSNEHLAWLSYMTSIIPYSLSFPIFYLFVRTYLGIKNDWYNLIPVAVILPACIASFINPALLFDLYFNPNLGYYTFHYSLLLMQLILSIGAYLFIAGMYLLIQALRKETVPIEQKRLQYLIFGASFSFFGIVAVLIPPIHILPWDMIGITITSLLLTYAIIKQQLLDIKVIIQQSLIYSVISISTIICFIVVGYVLSLLGMYSATLIPTQLLIGAFLVSAVVQYFYLNQQKVHKLLKEEQEINKKIRDMLLVTAHELRTPLTVISYNLSLISSGQGKSKLSPTDAEGLRNAAISANGLINMVNNYMDTALLDAGKETFSPEDVNACEITQKVIEKALSSLSNSHRVSLIFNCNRSHSLVKADPKKLEIVLANLIDNAIKFTPQGTVTVQHKTDSNNLITTVSDTGVGIPFEKQQFLFQEMRQLSEDVMTRQAGGLGLGLYVSKKFVELMRGQLWLEKSEEGKGSAFAFSLPLAK